jgi:hypothetical protein
LRTAFNFHSIQAQATTFNRDKNSAIISERKLQNAVAIISSFLSAALLFGSIVSLYFISDPRIVLGMLGVWTILFAVCVGCLTNARRDQIFAATAAYCAVLVVFVSGSLGNVGGIDVEKTGLTASCNCTHVP